MATATNLGPIGINQINNVFYVGGDGGFPNIQAAVDYVRVYNAGIGHVTIVHGYTGTETISSLVRGSSETYITDLRDTATQNYEWNIYLAQFSPADFFQLANAHVGGLSRAYGFIAPDLTASHTSIGTGNDRTMPIVTLVNAVAPANQRMWLMAAAPGELFFSAADDSGQDHSWMQVMRGAPGAASKVVITPPMDVTGILTSQGSPVRTFANSPDSGGGSTGGVNPGTQGQLSFYETTGPLVSPSLITTDTATQSNLTIPKLVQSAQANTNHTDFTDRTTANNFSYAQEVTYSQIGGGGVNLGSPWSVTQHRVDQMYHGQRGIAQIQGGFIERHAVGDTAGLYYYVRSDGGVAAGADEGVMGLGVQVLEDEGYFHGTVATTTGIGDQAPTYTLYTDGVSKMYGGHTVDGAFMLNISKGQLYGFWNGPSVVTYMDTGAGPTATFLAQLPVTGVLLANIPAWSASVTYAAGNIVLSGSTDYVSRIPGNKAYPPATSPGQWAVLASGQIPISTAIGIATTGYPYNNAPTNQPAPQPITVNLVKINGVYPTFAVGDVVTAASDEIPEQSIIMAPVTTTGTQQTFTLKLRNPAGRAIIFKGGIQGQYISMDANYAFSKMRSSYYALGSLTGNEIIYAFNVAGAVEGRYLPNSGHEAATSSGVNAGWHLYPGAEVVCKQNWGYNVTTLEQNGVRWQIGDSVENPHYPAGGGSGLLILKQQQTPTAIGGSTVGLSILLQGPGFCGGTADAIAILSQYPSTNFQADGGPVNPPGLIRAEGYYNYGLHMTVAPAGWLIQMDAPAAPVNNPLADVLLINIHYSLNGNFTYSANTGTWIFGGNLQAANTTVSTLTVNPQPGGTAASFYNGRATIDGTNDYIEFVFNVDSAGNKQRILGENLSGTDFHLYYDAFVDAGHVFRTTSWPSTTLIKLATIDYNGLTLDGTHQTATAVTLNVPGADSFQLVTWGAGNGNGLAGVFGLHDGTRAAMVWNTNALGDMFFNTPMAPNVGAGTGATAKITAAGLIDGTAFSVAGVAGASGTFTTADAHTVTVTHGLITAIV
jgi:hypothetical protein